MNFNKIIDEKFYAVKKDFERLDTNFKNVDWKIINQIRDNVDIEKFKQDFEERQNNYINELSKQFVEKHTYSAFLEMLNKDRMRVKPDSQMVIYYSSYRKNKKKVTELLTQMQKQINKIDEMVVKNIIDFDKCIQEFREISSIYREIEILNKELTKITQELEKPEDPELKSYEQKSQEQIEQIQSILKETASYEIINNDLAWQIERNLKDRVYLEAELEALEAEYQSKISNQPENPEKLKEVYGFYKSVNALQDKINRNVIIDVMDTYTLKAQFPVQKINYIIYLQDANLSDGHGTLPRFQYELLTLVDGQPEKYENEYAKAVIDKQLEYLNWDVEEYTALDFINNVATAFSMQY